MNKNEPFQLKVNDSFNFSLEPVDTQNLDIIKTPSGILHLIQGTSSVSIDVIERNFHRRNYVVKINGNTYKIDIETKLDALINELGLAKGIQKKINNVNAPMPGQIIAISVQPGQEVKENEPLLILEAMKMENVMVSPRDGMIKEVFIKTKDIVEKGQLLIEFV